MHRMPRFFCATTALLAMFPAADVWRGPYVETAPERATGFCNRPGTKEGRPTKCHQNMVTEALDFLRPWPLRVIRDHVRDPDDNTFLDYRPAQHFDACDFDGGTGYIRDQYRNGAYGVIPYLSPRHRRVLLLQIPPKEKLADYPMIEDALTAWAGGLHAAQDFYSHSNWVEMRMGLSRGNDDVVDGGLGPWRQLSSNWDRVRGDLGDGFGDVLTAQTSLPLGFPAGWRLSFPGNKYVPILTEPNGRRHHLLVSGEVHFTSERCPPIGRGFGHNIDLNKDDGLESQKVGLAKLPRPQGARLTATLHKIAAEMAIRQTRHEWCRLLHLARDQNGPEGAAVLLGLLTDPGKVPHPPGTPCSPASPGPVPVTVEVTDIQVLDDHEDDGPGQLNFVFSVFSRDMRRSIARQVDTIRVEKRGHVPSARLPRPITLCVLGTDRLIATVQGWENNGDADRTKLKQKDELLNGVVHPLGLVSGLTSRRPVTVTVGSANNHAQDLAVTFRTTAVTTHTDVRCNEQRVAAQSASIDLYQGIKLEVP